MYLPRPLCVCMTRLTPLVLAAALGSCTAGLDASLDPSSPAATAALPEPVEDVVPVVHVVAGRPDTLAVADLLGADLAVRFGRDPDVTVGKAGPDSVVVAARPGFSGLAVVPFMAGGADYALAVQSAVWPEMTITYTPYVRPLQVMPRPEVDVVGDFSDGVPVRLEDPDGDGTQTRTFTLEPGTYRYRLVVDGEAMPDPANPETVADTSGTAWSVLTVGASASGRLHLRVVGAEEADPSLLGLAVHRLGADGAPLPVDVDEEEGVVVLDHNRLLDDNAIDANYDEVLLDLDATEAGPRNLRVVVRAHGLISNWVEVPLVDRRPARARP